MVTKSTLPCRWGFGGKSDVVWVVGGEGQLGAWTQPAQLSSLRQSLDKRGVREAGLTQSLNAANMRSDWVLKAGRAALSQGMPCREQCSHAWPCPYCLHGVCSGCL